MKNYLLIIILLVSVLSCNSVSEEDISPVQITAPKSECTEPDGNCDDSGGEGTSPPPCYPNCG